MLNGNMSLDSMTSEQLFALYRSTGRLDVKQEIALRYLYTVKSIAFQMRGVYIKYEQIDDIVNEGILVVMNAIDKFSEERNVKFETYISKRIRGMIIDIARKRDLVPRSIRKSFREISETEAEFYSTYGRMPQIKETCEILEITEQKYHDILSKSGMISVLSLDTAIEDAQERQQTLQIISQNEEERPESNYLGEELKVVLTQGIRTLTEREQTVVSLYYVDEVNMKEIAEILNVSEPRISQIHANALKKLREFIENS